jgi:hypothetical protein
MASLMRPITAQLFRTIASATVTMMVSGTRAMTCPTEMAMASLTISTIAPTLTIQTRPMTITMTSGMSVMTYLTEMAMASQTTSTTVPMRQTLTKLIETGMKSETSAMT